MREYLPQYFEQYVYGNQKPLDGNKTSSVATSLKIFNKIIEEYSKEHQRDKHDFSNQPGCAGCCPTCGGAGYIAFDNHSTAKTIIECRECDGTGFNRKLEKLKIKGKSIIDVWRMTVKEAAAFFESINPKISVVLNDATSIMLGHLQLGQPSATLSGGENIRIKIIQIPPKAKGLGIDEPFKGLSNTELFCIVQYLDRLRAQGKTIIVVDHTENAIPYFSKHIHIKNKHHILTV